MASNMNKAIAVIGGIVALLAIIPIDLFAWWRWDVTTGGNSWPNWIAAFNEFHVKFTYDADYLVTHYDSMYLYAGIIVVIGAALMLIGGFSGKKFFAVIGAIITVLGPITFLIAHHGNSSLAAFLVDDVFFGSASTPGYSWTWYLSAGFFLPIGGAVLGFLSLKRNK
jgi:hypothetical protein